MINNKIKIEQIVKLFKEQFPLGWASSFVWDHEQGEESANSLREKVNSFEEEVFQLFSQSVLSGEYLIRNEFPETLDSLYELLTNAELYDDESNQFRKVAYQSFNLMTYELSRVIRSLRYLLTMLNNKYAERQTKYVVNAYKLRHERSYGSSYSRYYDVLLDVTQIDHFLSYDKHNIRNLIIYHTELTEAVNNQNLPEKSLKVLEVLNEKCLFLLKKLLIDDGKVFDYMIDFQPYHYDARELPFKFFSEMDSRFEFYRTENYTNDPIGDDLDIRARKNKLAIGDYTLLMKYYKDSENTRLVQIENILSDFDGMYDSLSEQFTQRPLDKYALGTLKNYMYNCKFSFMMKDKTYKFEQLKEDLNRIINIQYTTGILNFYPYRKAFGKALDLLHSNDSLKIEDLMEYKHFLELCISKFEESINWCRTNCFYPIQNCFRECLVPVAGFGAVFIASTFCRPVKYEKLKDELATYKNQMLLVDNEIALREEKNELKKLKTDIDNSKTREVEILSFFVGIITFLFGTIGFFANNNNSDFIHLIFSIFGLGAILLIFVSGIHLVTMRKEEHVEDYFKHPRAWFCIFTILISVGLLIWLMVKVHLLAA